MPDNVLQDIFLYLGPSCLGLRGTCRALLAAHDSHCTNLSINYPPGLTVLRHRLKQLQLKSLAVKPRGAVASLVGPFSPDTDPAKPSTVGGPTPALLCNQATLATIAVLQTLAQPRLQVTPVGQLSQLHLFHDAGVCDLAPLTALSKLCSLHLCCRHTSNLGALTQLTHLTLTSKAVYEQDLSRRKSAGRGVVILGMWQGLVQSLGLMDHIGAVEGAVSDDDDTATASVAGEGMAGQLQVHGGSHLLQGSAEVADADADTPIGGPGVNSAGAAGGAAVSVSILHDPAQLPSTPVSSASDVAGLWMVDHNLSSLTSLQELHIEHVSAHLRPLRALHNLQRLVLHRTHRMGLSHALRGLTALTHLHIQYPRVIFGLLSSFHLSQLSHLASLTHLGLVDCQLWSLDGMPSSLVALTSLNVSNNPEVSNLGPLHALERLRRLDISSTGVSALQPVAVLKQLTRLDACSCQCLTSLQPLADAPALQHLNIQGNSMLPSLSPLVLCPHLAVLDMRGCGCQSQFHVPASCQVLSG